jgi:phosphocarrier protein FPr
MVGLVLVSHSRPLAGAVRDLVRAMTGPTLPLALAAGAGDAHAELGTDAVEISEAILSVQGNDGVLVLMDIGSAILSSETALDLLDEAARKNVRFCAAPFVEGAIAAGVTANLGAPLEDVMREALAALRQKENALSHTAAPANEETPAPVPRESSPAAHTVRLTVRNLHGLHARPAARLINEARPFDAELTVRNLTNQRGPVALRSLSSLASLEILQNHEIEIAAAGADADAALEKVAQLVNSGLGEALPPSGSKAPGPPARAAQAAPVKARAAIPVSAGIVVGPARYLKSAEFDVPTEPSPNAPAEVARLRQAVARTFAALESRHAQMKSSAGLEAGGIYEAQRMALEDPELIDGAIRRMEEHHDNAARAWQLASKEIVARYQGLQDAYLRERAADVRDVGRQVLEALGVKKLAPVSSGPPHILIADDLNATEISGLNRELVLGVILLDGGPTAHSSILLRALGVPALVQTRDALELLDLARPGTLAFDGATGQIWIHPSDEAAAGLRARQEEDARQAVEEKKAALRPGATLDGARIEIFANVGRVGDAEAALAAGAEGIGLLRTEFLFLDRGTAPAEDEQVAALGAIAEKMEGRPVVVRTLDVGGDKPLSYAPAAPEENPFLGVRAMRLCLAQPELFRTQLRAILRAGLGHDFRIMFPMIADTADLARAREQLREAHAGLEKEGVPHAWPVPTGIMVEIPSAALQAAALAEEADFFSIGTNDLTQYTLAADRGNPALAEYQDSLHPAVLRLIAMVVAGAQARGRLVAVCGEAGADEKAALIFIGLGVRELSLSAGRVARIKARLAQHKLGELETLARRALECQTAVEVRQL